MTSDTPRRRGGAHPSSPARARLRWPTLARAGAVRRATHPVFRRDRAASPPGQDLGAPRWVGAGELVDPGRLPSARFLGLVDPGRRVFAHWSARSDTPGTLLRAVTVPILVRDSAVTSRSPTRPRLAARLDGKGTSHRLLQPTHDTCTRSIARFPTRAPRGDTLRVSPRLTARAQLRPPRSSTLAEARTVRRHRTVAPARWSCRPRARSFEAASDAFVAPRRAAGSRRPARSEPRPRSPHARQRVRLARPGRLPSTSATASALALPSPATDPAAVSVGVRLPAPRSPARSREPARPTSSPRARGPRPPWTGAARRLLQLVRSASTTSNRPDPAHRSAGLPTKQRPSRQTGSGREARDLTPPWRVAGVVRRLADATPPREHGAFATPPGPQPTRPSGPRGLAGRTRRGTARAIARAGRVTP